MQTCVLKAVVARIEELVGGRVFEDIITKNAFVQVPNFEGKIENHYNLQPSRCTGDIVVLTANEPRLLLAAH